MHELEKSLVAKVHAPTVAECLKKIQALTADQKAQLLFIYHNRPSHHFSDNLLTTLSGLECKQFAWE